MPLERYTRDILRCNKVKTCNSTDTPDFLPICPPYERFQFDSYSAPGLIFFARLLLHGAIKLNEELAECVYSCPECGGCEEICKETNKIPVMNILDEFRFDLVKAGFAPMPAHKEAADSIAKNHNPYGESHEERFAWLEEEVPSKADVVYFVGSPTAYRTPEIAKATVKVLKMAGVKFGIVDEWDSGELLFRTGQRELAADLIKHNVDVIKSAGAKTVVTSDPHAYATLKREYEVPGVEVLHTTEYFNNLIKAGKLKPKTLIKDKVTYHDPCNLGRRLGVYEPSREILKVLQVENIEMTRNKNKAWCCGAGGGVYLYLPDYAEWTATERLKEAEETGAKTVVTACPLCKANLTKAAQEMKSPLNVIDINELIAKTI